MADMAASKKQFCAFCQKSSKRQSRIPGRGTTDDQGIHTVIVLFHKAPYGQGSHTVTEKDQRKFRIFFPKRLVDERNIIQKSFCTASVHITEILLLAYTGTVASVVMDHCQETFRCQIFHKGLIAFFILTHSVNQLHDPPKFPFRSDLKNGKFQAVSPGFDHFMNDMGHSIPPFLSYIRNPACCAGFICKKRTILRWCAAHT